MAFTMGYIVISGSSNKDHIKENINVFDFKLTSDDMARIGKLEMSKLEIQKYLQII